MSGSLKLEGKHAVVVEKMLADIAELMFKADVEYIVDGGTLLGIVREGRLLPWDTDIDLSIRSDQAEKLIKQRWRLWLKGYRTRVKYLKKDIGPFKAGQVRIIKVQTHFMGIKKHDIADIFVKYKYDGEYLNLVGKTELITWAFPVKFLEQHQFVELNGKKYMAPVDLDEYLTLLYGDWKTPVKEWDFKTDMKCVKQE